MIYLDNAATTFPKPESVYSEMDIVNRTLSINAGRGSYKAAREATEIINDTKRKLLSLFHAENMYSVAFTPSITHAIDQIMWGVKPDDTTIIYLSPYEHNAVARTAEALRKKVNAKVIMLPVDNEGKIDIDRAKYLFAKDKPSLIIMTAISNVTGYRLPFENVFELAKESNTTAITVLDAAQAAGLIEIDVARGHIDILAFAGHKTLYGPFGIGGFVIKDSIKLDVTLTGGTGSNSLNLSMPEKSPERYEASSPNIVAVAGLRAALNAVNVEAHYSKMCELTTHLIKGLLSVSKVKILGLTDESKGIVSFVVDGYSSDDVGMILDEEFDIAVRTGYHCSPYVHDILKDQQYAGTVRASVGFYNTTEDIDALVRALNTL